MRIASAVFAVGLIGLCGSISYYVTEHSLAAYYGLMGAVFFGALMIGGIVAIAQLSLAKVD